MLKLLVGLALAAATWASPQAITVTVTETAAAGATGCVLPPKPCFAPCNIYSPWPNGVCGEVSNRVTCTPFNPFTNSANKGHTFCLCQAGYRGDGLGLDGTEQYRISWANDLGDQTHRVFVKPGTACNQLCNDNNCSEVPIRNECA